MGGESWRIFGFGTFCVGFFRKGEVMELLRMWTFFVMMYVVN